MMTANHAVLMVLQHTPSIGPGTYLPPIVDRILAATDGSGEYIRTDALLSDAAVEAATLGDHRLWNGTFAWEENSHLMAENNKQRQRERVRSTVNAAVASARPPALPE